jgi:TetR/AcrR family transcriptional repressor of nem operon
MASLPAIPPPTTRGRPPKRRTGDADARTLLVRAGVAAMTEYGFTATGLDLVLKAAGIPKGSFYYYFASKDDFALAVVEAYAAYFAKKLDRTLGDAALPAPRRLRAFCADAARGLVKYDFRRGCLVGNLGQEIASLAPPLREALARTLADWERRLAACLREGQARCEVAAHVSPRAHAAFFWTGWEGAILRARLQRELKPLKLFERLYLAGLAPPPNA